jgi:hypothetical protein
MYVYIYIIYIYTHTHTHTDIRIWIIRYGITICNMSYVVRNAWEYKLVNQKIY